MTYNEMWLEAHVDQLVYLVKRDGGRPRQYYVHAMTTKGPALSGSYYGYTRKEAETLINHAIDTERIYEVYGHLHVMPEAIYCDVNNS